MCHAEMPAPAYDQLRAESRRLKALFGAFSGGNKHVARKRRSRHIQNVSVVKHFVSAAATAARVRVSFSGKSNKNTVVANGRRQNATQHGRNTFIANARTRFRVQTKCMKGSKGCGPRPRISKEMAFGLMANQYEGGTVAIARAHDISDRALSRELKCLASCALESDLRNIAEWKHWIAADHPDIDMAVCSWSFDGSRHKMRICVSAIQVHSGLLALTDGPKLVASMTGVSGDSLQLVAPAGPSFSGPGHHM